ncbi:MAG: SDR family NAD(P)-dependent oxidoreductase [Christensenellaceae bacterium]|jgi:NAD(P)-dependent dehydrogenase (short-subunit alcohol dehydrogenase family)
MAQEEKQIPVKSPFNHFTKSMEIIENIDLHGKTAVVTGGYTGVGLWSTKAFVKAGAHVIVLSRDMKRAKHHLRKVPNVEIEYFDLLKPKSIDAVADKIVSAGRPIHILVNSAGIIGVPLTRDARGYEYQLTTNHLGPFQLVARLYPALKRAQGARVVLVSSRGHKWGGVQFDDPNFLTSEYTPNRAYAQSKSAISLFAVQLDALAQKDSIRAFAVHPGPIPSSDLFAESIVGIKPPHTVALMRLSAKLMRGLHITGLLNALRHPQVEDAYKIIQQGAATPVWCATSTLLDGMGGVYCEDCNIAKPVPAGSDLPYGVRPWAIDPILAKQLWTLSEEMTGVQFDI